MQLLLAMQLLPAASPPWLPAAMRGAPDAPHLLLLLLWAEAREALQPGLLSPLPGAQQPSEPVATAGPPVAALVPPLPPWDAIPAPLLALLALMGLAALWPAFAAAALCAATPLSASRSVAPPRPPSGPRAVTAAARLGRCGRALQAAHRAAAAAALWLAEASGRWSLAPAVLGLLVCAAAQTAVPLPDTNNNEAADDVLAAAAAWDDGWDDGASPGHAAAVAATSRACPTARIELRLGCGVLLHALAAAAALLAVQHARAAACARRPPPLAATAPSAAAAVGATARGMAWRARARSYARLRAALHAASVLVACVALLQPMVALQTLVSARGRLIALTPPRRLSLLGLLISAAGARARTHKHLRAHTQTPARAHTNTCARTHKYLRAHARTYAPHVHVCMHMHMHMQHAHACTCMHMPHATCTAACAHAHALLVHCSRPQARCAPLAPWCSWTASGATRCRHAHRTPLRPTSCTHSACTYTCTCTCTCTCTRTCTCTCTGMCMYTACSRCA
jgi:hypothetical protein